MTTDFFQIARDIVTTNIESANKNGHDPLDSFIQQIIEEIADHKNTIQTQDKIIFDLKSALTKIKELLGPKNPSQTWAIAMILDICDDAIITANEFKK